MGKDALLDELNAEFDDLMKTVDGLRDEQMTTVWFGDWDVRAIMVHIADWHWEMARAFERMARGERPVPEGVDYSDVDAWNARFAEAQRHTTPDEAMENLIASKDAFVAAARKVPEDRLHEGRAGFRILHSTGIEHYREHAPAIREWRRSLGI